MTLVVCLISQSIYTPVCPSVLRQNVDLYSAPIDSKPVYCDIVYDTPLLNDSDFCLAPVCFLVLMIFVFLDSGNP